MKCLVRSYTSPFCHSEQSEESFNTSKDPSAYGLRMTGESGNAIWFVLIAVVLMAALTMTITRSSDTTEQSGNTEQLRVQASTILRYAQSIEHAIDQMTMRGISESDLCFDATGWGHSDYDYADCGTDENKLFDPAGAGLSYKVLNGVTAMEFSGSHAIQDVETTANDLIFQAEVSRTLCMELNDLLGITNAASDAQEDDAALITRFTGTFTSAAGDNIIGNDAAVFAGERSACRKDAAGDYYFYHVLIAR